METKIEVITVKDVLAGSIKALQLLNLYIDGKTLLFLSGGKTPELLYTMIAKEKKLHPGAVALTDERYGTPLHKDSNEVMIAETRLVEYFNENNIPYYEILDYKKKEELAMDYERLLQFLLKEHTKRIAILGIGEDGHIAGIPINSKIEKERLVTAHNTDIKGFSKRVTVTLPALGEIQTIILLAFGKEKKQALRHFLTKTDYTKYPATYLKTTPAKIFVITDQNFTS